MYVCIWVYDLWDGEAGNGETRNDIRPQEFETVIRPPLEDGEEKLKTQKQFLEPRLVLESVEWIIREEDLGQPVSEFLKSGFVGWQTDFVHFQIWHCFCTTANCNRCFMVVFSV